MLREKISAALECFALNDAVEIPRLGQSISYIEMAALGDVIASKLQLSNDTLLVLCVDKSIAAISLFVHAFVCGYSICPVDPRMPSEGLLRISRQFRKSVIVTNKPSVALPLEAVSRSVEELAEYGWFVEHRTVRESPECPAEAAYFISTSGSTGDPKLVHVPQDNLEKILVDSAMELQDEDHMRWAQFSSMGFDLFIEDLFYTILSGGTLVVPEGLAEMSRLGRFAAENGITHWNSVPSIIPRLATRDLPQLRRAVFCGEPLLVEHCKLLASRAPNVAIFNTYCPTETALYSSEYRVTSKMLDEGLFSTVPIGNPTSGTNFFYQEESEGLRCFIIDPSIAEGYWGGHQTGFGQFEIGGKVQRYFDTGDYFRLENGEYVFSHRKDRMIKVRGNRVDLGEVQNALAIIGLYDVAIWFSDGRIFCAIEGCKRTEMEIMEDLKAVLPSYMYPGKIIFVDRLPRTQSGKIDTLSLMKDM